MKRDALLTLFALAILVASTLFTESCKNHETESPVREEIITNGITTAVFNPSLTYGTLTDHDGNTYKTITIGTQTWMAENLRTTKYRNGDAIPEVTGNSAWWSLRTAAYCNYENSKNNIDIATYGRFYNWYAMTDARNIAPEGWHVPTEADWTILMAFLGGESSAGGKMKETGTTHWNVPNANATNQSGFTILPSGVRDGNAASGDGTFFNKRKGGYLWIAGSGVRYVNISFDSAEASLETDEYKQDGFSIRCIMD